MCSNQLNPSKINDSSVFYQEADKEVEENSEVAELLEKKEKLLQTLQEKKVMKKFAAKSVTWNGFSLCMPRKLKS